MVEDQYNVAYNQDALRWLVLPMKLTLNACTWLLIDARDFFVDLYLCASQSQRGEDCFLV